MKFLKNYLVEVAVAAVTLTGLTSCERSEVAVQSLNASPEGAAQEKFLPPHEVSQLPLMITYHIDSMETAAEVDSFKLRFSSLEQEYIFAINRMDAYRLNPGDKLVIPDTLSPRFLDYSPFPEEFEMLDSIPKTVLISRRVQAFGLYENGKLIRWGPVSSGKRSTPTPAGLFYGNYKARKKISTVNDSWLMPYYFNFMNFEGVGVHEYSMPGYPASHACVRLRKDDAVTIYNWADQWKLDLSGRVVQRNGTPFMVFGEYNYDGPAPWLQLADNPNSNYLSAEEMNVLRGYVNTFKKDRRNYDTIFLPEEGSALSSSNNLKTLK